MRLIPSDYIKPGMILAKNLYGLRNELLLVCGTTLTETLIEKMKLSGCEGAFISSGVSDIDCDDIVDGDNKSDGDNNRNSDNDSESDDENNSDSGVHGIISTKLKENTVSAVRNIFTGISQGDTQLASQSFETMKNLLDDIIDEISTDGNAIVNMVDLKVFDEYTYYHSVNVAALSIMLGVTAKMNRNGLYKLGMGAILHDIGKIFIPKEVLNKMKPLTSDEFEIIKKHSQFGSDYLKKQNPVPLESLVAVLTHHERYDSKGYPLGLPANKQIIEGKIITVCDNYDAMTSDRPYRPAFSPSEAMEHLMGNSGVMFDPKVVNLLIKKIVLYPVGTTVVLSNGKIGTVIKNYPSSIMRPKIRLQPDMVDPGGKTIYDLYNDLSLYNVTVTGIERKKNEKIGE
jgi:HD-GYP domain